MTADQLLRQELKAKGLKYVGTRGTKTARTWLIGEAPGGDEDASATLTSDGVPFIGYSGKLLDKMLDEVGFPNGSCCYSNPYKSRPPDNDIKRLHELGIPAPLFIDQFLEELRIYKPTILVTCGKTPTNLLVPDTKPKIYRKGQKEDKEGFGSWRGSLLQSPLLDWPHYVIPMYHPAFVLRNYSEREICTLILARAFEELQYWNTNHALQALPLRQLITNPDFGVAYDFLRRCLASPEPISIDIELLNRKVPYTISFAINPAEAISMSFWNYQEAELTCLWRMIDAILATKQQIGQNYCRFDAHWLRGLGFNVNIKLVHDTLIRHHVLWTGLRHSLEFQTMQYTREPYYKEEGKAWSLKKEGLDKLMRYNCKDTTVTYEIYNSQEAEFNERAA
jgi:uracil-DNA glycosylase family 4